MYDTEIVCTICGKSIKRYDSKKGDYLSWKYCPICGSEVEHKSYSPDI